MAQITDTQVTAGPSGQYGFYLPTNSHSFETEPVVQVAQFIEGFGWSGTPARHYATSVAASQTPQWSIDYGQGWKLQEADTEAFKAFAREVLEQFATSV